MSNNISNALNLNVPVPIDFEQRQVDLPRDQSEDLRYIRENMLHSIEVGHNALSQVATLAAQSQTPDMYEVLTKLVEVTMKANKDLANLVGKEGGGKKEEHVHQNLFVGSTAELLEMMQKKKSGG